MTTIAYKSGVLAADSRMTKADGTLVSDTYSKIVDCEDEEYTIQGERVLAFALSGVAKARSILAYALAEGITVASALDTDDFFSAIVVTEDRAYHVSKDEETAQLSILGIEEGEPFCCGTGGKIAHHYLLHYEVDPVDAVVQAIKSDVFSGGEVERWSRE